MKAAIDEHLNQNIGGYDLVFVARGMTPRLKSWQLSEVVARLFAQAGLPDKAKQPGAKPLPRSRLQTGPQNSESRLPCLPERALCAHPVLPALYQPGAGPQLPLYPHLQPVWHRSHPDPWLHQGLAAHRLAHRPVQPAWPLGL